MKVAAEVVRGGPSRSNWTELCSLAEDFSTLGEWEEAVPRWALALKQRLSVAVHSAVDTSGSSAARRANKGYENENDDDDGGTDARYACTDQSCCYGPDVFMNVAAMRRQYAVSLAHTGSQPAALVQSILAVRAEEMALASGNDNDGIKSKIRIPAAVFDRQAVVAELTALPSHGWHDEKGILNDIQLPKSLNSAIHTAEISDSDGSIPDVEYRTPEQHAALFPMGFVHDLVGRRGSSFGTSNAESEHVVGLVSESSILPTQSMFMTVLAPGAGSGAALPGCQRAVNKLCGLDLATVEENEIVRTKNAHALFRCVENHREALELQCLIRGIGQPLLLRGAARRLPAYTHWQTDAALDRKYGDQILQTVEQEKVARRSTPSISMNVSEFLQRYNRNTPNDELYAITVLPPAMCADVGPIDQGGATGFLPDGSVSTGPRLWFSSGATSSVLHKDMLDNVNCVIAGGKHVAIVHPRLNDLVEAEQWEQLEWVEAVVSEGDCLFIPGGWYHQVTTPSGRSIAVNNFFQRPDS
eukprot:COSAG02_NODE_3078_length_7417_cov_563.409538_3_plen_528_part_00